MRERSGGKGANLAELSRSGMNVPDVVKGLSEKHFEAMEDKPVTIGLLTHLFMNLIL